MNSTQNYSVDQEDSWSLELCSKISIMVVFGMVLTIGIVGNVVVLLIIFLDKSMQTTVNLCLAVLAMADLGVLTMLPILSVVSLFDLDAVFIGRNFCKFLTFYDRGALVCSVLIFLCISLERYIALCHPLKTLYQCRGWRMGALLASIWCVSCLLSIPYCYISHFKEFPTGANSTHTYCYLQFDQQWMMTYETVLICLVFLLPVPALCYLYGRMVHALQNVPLSESSGPGTKSIRRSRSQVIKMLITVVAIFVTCNVPFRIYVLIYFYGNHVLAGLTSERGVALLWTIRLLSYVNNSANPFIYFSVSSNFREAFGRVFLRKSSSKFERTHTYSRQTSTTTM